MPVGKVELALGVVQKALGVHDTGDGQVSFIEAGGAWLACPVAATFSNSALADALAELASQSWTRALCIALMIIVQDVAPGELHAFQSSLVDVWLRSQLSGHTAHQHTHTCLLQRMRGLLRKQSEVRKNLTHYRKWLVKPWSDTYANRYTANTNLHVTQCTDREVAVCPEQSNALPPSEASACANPEHTTQTFAVRSRSAATPVTAAAANAVTWSYTSSLPTALRWRATKPRSASPPSLRQTCTQVPAAVAAVLHRDRTPERSPVAVSHPRHHSVPAPAPRRLPQCSTLPDSLLKDFDMHRGHAVCLAQGDESIPDSQDSEVTADEEHRKQREELQIAFTQLDEQQTIMQAQSSVIAAATVTLTALQQYAQWLECRHSWEQKALLYACMREGTHVDLEHRLAQATVQHQHDIDTICNLKQALDPDMKLADFQEFIEQVLSPDKDDPDYELPGSCDLPKRAESSQLQPLPNLMQAFGPHGRNRMFHPKLRFAVIQLLVCNLGSGNVSKCVAAIGKAFGFSCTCKDFPKATTSKHLRQEAYCIGIMLMMLSLRDNDWTLLFDKTSHRHRQFGAFTGLTVNQETGDKYMFVLGVLEQVGGSAEDNMTSFGRLLEDCVQIMTCYYREMQKQDPAVHANARATTVFTHIVATMADRGSADSKFLQNLTTELKRRSCSVAPELQLPHDKTQNHSYASQPTTLQVGSTGRDAATVPEPQTGANQPPLPSISTTAPQNTNDLQASSAAPSLHASSACPSARARPPASTTTRAQEPAKHNLFCWSHFTQSMGQQCIQAITTLEAKMFCAEQTHDIDTTEMRDGEWFSFVLKGGISCGVSREAMKLFFPWTACNQCGYPIQFQDFQEQNGGMSVRDAGGQAQNGKRFNANLSRACATALLRESICDFIQLKIRASGVGGQVNQLLLAVLHKLSINQNISSLLAVALLHLLFFEPLLEAIQAHDKDAHILDQCLLVSAMVTLLETWVASPNTIMPPSHTSSSPEKPAQEPHTTSIQDIVARRGQWVQELLPSKRKPWQQHKQDELLTALLERPLFQDESVRCMIECFVQTVAATLLSYIQQNAADYMSPAGKWHLMREDTAARHVLASVPLSNSAVENTFGILDSEVRRLGTALPAAWAAGCMWKAGHVHHQLLQLEDNTQLILVRAARRASLVQQKVQADRTRLDIIVRQRRQEAELQAEDTKSKQLKLSWKASVQSLYDMMSSSVAIGYHPNDPAQAFIATLMNTGVVSTSRVARQSTPATPTMQTCTPATGTLDQNALATNSTTDISTAIHSESLLLASCNAMVAALEVFRQQQPEAKVVTALRHAIELVRTWLAASKNVVGKANAQTRAMPSVQCNALRALKALCVASSGGTEKAPAVRLSELKDFLQVHLLSCLMDPPVVDIPGLLQDKADLQMLSLAKMREAADLLVNKARKARNVAIAKNSLHAVSDINSIPHTASSARTKAPHQAKDKSTPPCVKHMETSLDDPILAAVQKHIAQVLALYRPQAVSGDDTSAPIATPPQATSDTHETIPSSMSVLQTRHINNLPCPEPTVSSANLIAGTTHAPIVTDGARYNTAVSLCSSPSKISKRHRSTCNKSTVKHLEPAAKRHRVRNLSCCSESIAAVNRTPHQLLVLIL